jgi:hypothetical protein
MMSENTGVKLGLPDSQTYGPIGPLPKRTAADEFIEKLRPLLPRDPTAADRTAAEISEACREIRDMLLEKNRKYGDSALNPKRIFSRADPAEQLNVRIDDKLSRIANQQPDEDEDVDLDLIGYLILRRIAKARQQQSTKQS